jgi:biotin carboxyl carrier protein
MDESFFLQRLNNSPGDVAVLREYASFLRNCDDPRAAHLQAELDLADAENRLTDAERHLASIRNERTNDFDWLNNISPMVTRAHVDGCFYSSAAPDEEPFVRIGDFCHRTTVVGIIESKKIFFHIVAGHSGVITKVYIGNGASVALGDPLFQLVRPKKTDVQGSRTR